jgi:hypothetical protein
LIVNRFFGGAQIPTGRMAQDVAVKLAEAGHEVIALASSGEYDGTACSAAGIRQAAYGKGTEEGKVPGLMRVETVRVPMWMPRALAWVWFTWQARKRIPQMDWDVCVLMTDPPLLPLLATRAKTAGIRHAADGVRGERGTAGARRVAVWLMDLYPEALAASGRVRRRNPVYRWYWTKRQRALESCDLVICLGEAQKEQLQVDQGTMGPHDHGTRMRGESSVGVGRFFGRAVGTETPAPPGTVGVRTVVVPPWDDRGNLEPATEASLQDLALYAGNLGEAHTFQEVLAAAEHLPPDWTIRFAARGAKVGALKAAASGRRQPACDIRDEADLSTQSGDTRHRDLELKAAGAVVHISGYASEEETPGLLASAKVHLITMGPGWEGVVVPSKLYGCLQTGRPVLFIGPERSDTAREILRNNWGEVLPPGATGGKVAAAILELAATPTKEVELPCGAAKVTGELVQLAGGDG